MLTNEHTANDGAAPHGTPDTNEHTHAADTVEKFSQYTATYSPEDNKLRLYALHRLDDDTYARVKAAGFKYAPKQQLWVAPMWTPPRHDLLLELCGEIDSEDISLEERAAERAERFEGYQAARMRDAERARDAASALAGGIPFGQPILVGHHSERRARKDAERIQNGMRRAVSQWETSEHWAQRAAGALHNAEYKSRADVRHRRIKGLESDQRKQQKYIDEAEAVLNMWKRDDLNREIVLRIAGFTHISQCFPLDKYPRDVSKSQYEGQKSLHSALADEIITEDQARDIAIRVLTKNMEWHRRWHTHFTNRLAYERAMLQEQGGIAADKFDIQLGGRVLVRGEWATVKRITRKGGRIVSVTTNARFVPVRSIEEVADYQAPTAEVAEAAKAASKLAPLANYPGEGFGHMTKAEWDKIHKDYKGAREQHATATAGRHRLRYAKGVYAGNLADDTSRHSYVPVYITDAKRVDAPAPATDQGAQPPAALPAPEPAASVPRQVQPPREENAFDAMREQLNKGGVQVVSAPQLFPTPPQLAARMVDLSGLAPGMRWLEPSVGMGAIPKAVRFRVGGAACVAVEINTLLCDQLRVREPGIELYNRDFLECTPDDLGLFDCILMNPPFANEQDVKHIMHALQFLKPGGELVAICAAGPARFTKLRPMIEENGGLWELLPSGTFESSGTMVSSVLLTYTKPE